jgi:hypothetical protein
MLPIAIRLDGAAGRHVLQLGELSSIVASTGWCCSAIIIFFLVVGGGPQKSGATFATTSGLAFFVLNVAQLREAQGGSTMSRSMIGARRSLLPAPWR